MERQKRKSRYGTLSFVAPTPSLRQGHMQLSLLVPELIWPNPEDSGTLAPLDCPALAALITRGRQSMRTAQSLEATLGDAFGHVNVAYSPFRLLGEANALVEANTGCWLNADPIHLRFHQNLLVLSDSASFGIQLDEARTLADALNEHLTGVGRFHVAAADRWYLQLADSSILDELDTPPLSTMIGRSIDRFLPDSPALQGLRQLLNEAQMVLFAHPLNQRRENEGRPPINGLWLWGGGRLPARRDSDADCDFDGVWSVNPLARGLARAVGVPTHPVPVDAETLLEHAASATHHLVVLEDLLGPVHYENAADYRTALHQLEKRWFSPLLAALKAGHIRRLRIEASTAYAAVAWESGRSDHWKFWRRPPTLAAIAQKLAKESA
jgi:hypothetical protein